MKLLKIKMLKSCVILLTVISCSSRPATRFKANWDFCGHSSGETWACINEADTKELRRVLIQCGKN